MYVAFAISCVFWKSKEHAIHSIQENHRLMDSWPLSMCSLHLLCGVRKSVKYFFYMHKVAYIPLENLRVDLCKKYV